MRAHAQSRAELDDGAARDADQWRDRGVRVAAAEQERLHLLVRAVERGVAPVEAAAPLRDAHEQRHEHGAIRIGVHARGRLAREVVERGPHVLTVAQPLGLALDERLHERAVLVERRRVLLEREREVLPVEDGERTEAEPAHRVVQVRRAHGPAAYVIGMPPHQPVRGCQDPEQFGV